MNSRFNLHFVYSGALTKRFHTVETIKTQNIAEHSFGVAWLCEWLTNGGASKELIMAALEHDLAEQVTGDIPAPAKRQLGIRDLIGKREETILRNNGLRYADGLNTQEISVLKMADAIDGMVFCLREMQLGNTTMNVVFIRFRSYVMELEEKLPCDGRVKYIVDYVTKLFEEI